MIGTLIKRLEDLNPGDIFYASRNNSVIYFIVSRSRDIFPTFYVLYQGKIKTYGLTGTANGLFYRVEL